MPFAGASFDPDWGNTVLQRLDLDVAARELHRVLRPGGIAVFCEPWGASATPPPAVPGQGLDPCGAMRVQRPCALRNASVVLLRMESAPILARHSPGDTGSYP